MPSELAIEAARLTGWQREELTGIWFHAKNDLRLVEYLCEIAPVVVEIGGRACSWWCNIEGADDGKSFGRATEATVTLAITTACVEALRVVQEAREKTAA